MISIVLAKRSYRQTMIPWIIILAVLIMYFSLVVPMFDPVLGASLQQFTDSMPELMAMFGMDQLGKNLTEFMSNYLYGFLMLLFPMIFMIMASNRLIAAHVDRGSMGYLLAAPIHRVKVAFTQLFVLVTGVFFMDAVCTGVGILVAEIVYPGELDIKHFLYLNIGVFCLHLAISGICFFASCIANDTKKALLIGGGIPVLFYLIYMLSNMGGDLKVLKYATIFSLFRVDGLLTEAKGEVIPLAILGGIGLVLWIIGMVSFSKRDLPL